MGERIVLSCERADWQTPADFVKLVRQHRRIVLDPCAAIDRREWFADWNSNGIESGPGPRFEAWLARQVGLRLPEMQSDGLRLSWYRVTRPVFGRGLVFMNPPYGGRKKAIDGWLEKAEQEAKSGVEIIGLVPAATGAGWFRFIWRSAQAVCFVKGRMRFVLPGGEKRTGATFWSAAPYWGSAVERFASVFGAVGRVVVLSVPNAKRHRLADKGAAHVPR